MSRGIRHHEDSLSNLRRLLVFVWAHFHEPPGSQGPTRKTAKLIEPLILPEDREGYYWIAEVTILPLKMLQFTLNGQSSQTGLDHDLGGFR